MKKIILLIFVILFTYTAFSQSLIVYKTDKTALTFNLAQVDSITFSAVLPEAALTPVNWTCTITEPVVTQLDAAAGVFEQTVDGLKLYGNDNQTYVMLHPTAIAGNSITDKTIYLKWKADGSGSFINVNITLYSDTTLWNPACQVTNLSTTYTADGSTLIADNTWYYTRLVISANKATATTAKEDYDDNGGTIIQQMTSTLSEPVKTFGVGAKANSSSYIVLGEVTIM